MLALGFSQKVLKHLHDLPIPEALKKVMLSSLQWTVTQQRPSTYYLRCGPHYFTYRVFGVISILKIEKKWILPLPSAYCVPPIFVFLRRDFYYYYKNAFEFKLGI